MYCVENNSLELFPFPFTEITDKILKACVLVFKQRYLTGSSAKNSSGQQTLTKTFTPSTLFTADRAVRNLLKLSRQRFPSVRWHSAAFNSTRPQQSAMSRNQRLSGLHQHVFYSKLKSHILYYCFMCEFHQNRGGNVLLFQKKVRREIAKINSKNVKQIYTFM